MVRRDTRYNGNWKGGPVTLECSFCNIKFQKSRGSYNACKDRNKEGRFYCCRKCADKGKKKYGTVKKERLSTELLTCVWCQEQYNAYLSQRRGKLSFCSEKCKKEYKRYYGKLEVYFRYLLTCPECGKIFYDNYHNVFVKNRKCCSWKCNNSYYVGEKGHGWRGGIAPMSSVLRNIKEYHEWEKSVRYRDSDTCKKCGEINHIHVHHIIEWSDLIKKYNIDTVDKARECSHLWDINNGVCLCVHCHAEEHPDRRKWMLNHLKIV